MNPGENFADKWKKNPALERNFWLWREQALRDFRSLAVAPDAGKLSKLAESSLAITIAKEKAERLTGRGASQAAAYPTIVISRAPQPWG